MEIGSRKWIALVRDGAAQLGVQVSLDQAVQFARHGRRLMAWNRKTNLTAITDPEQVAIKHFVDAIAPLSHFPQQGRLLDIGTGGGFPGIPLKIMRPAQPMTLIDSVRKKINFIKLVIRELSLKGIDAHHTRAEALSENSADKTKYSIVTCRALTDLNRAVELAAPLLAPDGIIVLYQGPSQNANLPNTPSMEYTVGGLTYGRRSIAYSLPLFGDDRIVTILQRR